MIKICQSRLNRVANPGVISKIKSVSHKSALYVKGLYTKLKDLFLCKWIFTAQIIWFYEMRHFTFKWLLKAMLWLLFISLLVLIIFTHFIVQQNDKHLQQQAPNDLLPPTWNQFGPKNIVQSAAIAIHNESMVLEQPVFEIIRRDWHDYAAMEMDRKRKGPGENGEKLINQNKSTKALEQQMSLENGFNAFISDQISVNRSLPDIRYKGCQQKKYLTRLPTVSVVMPYYNEYFSVLMRSVHSLINRSPSELLKEIILVDDCSKREYLFEPLNEYIANHFSIVQIVHLKERTGLIGARMAGARRATSDVLIFLDSHIETNYNWMPPLLEPIALNYRTAVCPFIDVIDHANFNYHAQDEGARGAFDWEFYYKRLNLPEEDLVDRTKPFRSPVMAGGLFAISRRFFFELGGYDEGLDIWGGEQYELSFKIWMCGGILLDAPCSRVGHIYRGPRNHEPSPRKGDYLHRNYKRVAEVWMDEYKQYLYARGKGVYERIDAGDLTEQKALREKLKCKSFKWFMDEIAYDILKAYPAFEPIDYAHGTIRSLGTGQTNFCLDTMGRSAHSKVGLYPCHDDLENPGNSQYWKLSWRRDIRMSEQLLCLDVQSGGKNAPVYLWECHGQEGNQFWSYNQQYKWLVHGESAKNIKIMNKRLRCLEAVPHISQVIVNSCDKKNPNMKWSFGVLNDTALSQFWDGKDNTTDS